MLNLPPPILGLARAQYGLVTRDQLDEHVGRHARARHIRDLYLVPVHRSVYRLGSHDPTFEQLCLGACLARPDVVVSGLAAGRLLSLRKMGLGDVHVMTTTKNVELEGVVVHSTGVLGSDDFSTRHDGIRVLKSSRLAPDLARFLDDDDFESVVEQMLDRRSVSIPSLFAMGRRLKRQGRDGMRRYARVLESRPAWLKPADSDLELRLLRALAARGVHLERQVEVDLGPGIPPIHLDGGDRERRFGVEVDHVRWHGGRLSAQNDKWRDRRTLRIGWTVVRVTDEDIDKRLASTLDDLVAIWSGRVAA